MSEASPLPSDLAFSATVKAIQQRKGSRAAYAKMEAAGSWPSRLSDDMKYVIEAQTSVFLATANAQGQPYVQHRGGPAGFLKVLDPVTIAFADYSGNRQFITQGNLQENPRAHLFLIDYMQRQRFKLWGTARVIEDDPDRLAALMPDGYRARPEQVIEFKVAAWEANCPQHIPQRLDASVLYQMVEERDQRIARLEAELARLRDPDPGD
ncbi:MAG: pyridoxamine 5'-phosphate oxidase family protein [Burkholderiaceae bacterium]